MSDFDDLIKGWDGDEWPPGPRASIPAPVSGPPRELTEPIRHARHATRQYGGTPFWRLVGAVVLGLLVVEVIDVVVVLTVVGTALRSVAP